MIRAQSCRVPAEGWRTACLDSHRRAQGARAVAFRRPTKVFENAVQKTGLSYMLTLDDAIASRGSIPLIEDGKLIGAIGCSGGTGLPDEAFAESAQHSSISDRFGPAPNN